MIDILTIVCLVLISIVGIALVAWFVYNWGTWSDNTRQAVITQMYAVAKTLWVAVADGKITPGETRQLFVSVLSVIAAMRGVTLNEVEQEFPKTGSGKEQELPAVTSADTST